MKEENNYRTFAGGEVRFWIEQGSSIQLRAVSGVDPVELTEDEALEIGEALAAMARRLKEIE
jgi:hypothetical protein